MKVPTRTTTAILTAVLASLLGLLLGTAPAFAVDRVTDADIAYWVKDALRQDPRVDASEIQVLTEKGIVTLSGRVRNLASKRYADLEAKKINGVLGVINKVMVAPNYRSDTDIAHEVRRRILNSAVIESQGLQVTCADGKITLSGKVASWAESQQADLLASEARGVRNVENDLAVVYATARSDEEIKNDIVGRLARDVYLTGLPITVTVDAGIVTLAGKVGNAYEKARAGSEIRWVSHVKNVRNDLQVTWWENRGTRRKNSQPSDEDLGAAVRAELDQDSRVMASDISIVTSYGHVTLDGSVPSHYQKRIAEHDVRDMVGVGWVTNNLFVRADRRADSAIRSDVQFNFNTDNSLNGDDIEVKAKDGVVTLSGTTNTWYEKTHAEHVTTAVRGVRQVVNHIQVNWDRRYTDAALANKINNRLQWNWTTNAVFDKIHVAVSGGVATLTGDIDTWAQWREADRVAFKTEGIWLVDNRLMVNGYDYPWNDWYSKGPYSYAPSYNPSDRY